MLRILTRAESSASIVGVTMALAYGVLPALLYRFAELDHYYLQLAILAALGAPAVVLGSRIPLLDRWTQEGSPRFTMSHRLFLWTVWGSFGAFVFLASVTAERMPLVAAVQGADAETLAVLREQFLKAREGWQGSFVYVNLALAGALVPYSLATVLLRRHRCRWVLFGAFFLYCISFVEKAFFLKAFIPLMYLVAQDRIRTWVKPRVLLGLSAGVLLLVTVLSGTGARESRGEGAFFSSQFGAQGVAAFLVWRAVAVPIVTAADALMVFDQEYGGRPLMGASSSLLAAAFGLERVNIEREVFAAQWGQSETETGSANAVYLTEAFLNFGYAGVVVFSLLIGMILRVFATTRDEALRSLWMLFGMSVLIAPLTATVFSSGFLLVIVMSMLLELTEPEAEDPRMNGA